MKLRTASIWLVATAATFVACCLVMLHFGPDMQSRAVIYPFIAAWGVSALAWPLFAIWGFKAAVASVRPRRRTRERNGS